MEVHHHPHIPHGKKPFKEYFLEFIMIFLAVTMGFIAENVRETISDHSKEHEYVEGLLENLGTDTVNLLHVMKQTKVQLKGLDSLRHTDKAHISNPKTQDSLAYFTQGYLFYINDFKNNDITLTQLRNAGGYRLIHNKMVVDSVADYESRIKDLNEEYAFIASIFTKTRDAATEIFDLSVPADPKKRKPGQSVFNPGAISRVGYYYNQCHLSVAALNSYYIMMKEHLRYTKSLIALIKKEYRLE